MKKWHGKIIIIDNKRNVDYEMVQNGLKMVDVIEILDEGVQVTKRKKEIHEKWIRRGKYIRIAIVEDCGDYWLLRHVSEITATKKKLKLMRGEK